MIKSWDKRDGLRRFGSNLLIVSSIQEHFYFTDVYNLIAGYSEY